MYDWNDLKYFLAVARNGSSLAAAKAVGSSQSTVHRRLKELEKQLGGQLVSRRPTGYRLTELGEYLRADAERVEEAALTFERHISASRQEISGVVRVTCPEAVGYRLMRSPLLAMFKERFPALLVEFVMTDELLDLAKGEADIAIRAVAPRDDTLVGRKIADLQWAVYASRSYVEQHGHIAHPADVDGHVVIKFDGELNDHLAARWLDRVAPNARVAARAKNLPALVLAVKSGAGLAPLPIIVGDSESDFCQLFGPIKDIITPFYLLMHKDMKQTPRVRYLFDFIIEELKSIRLILGG
jgi:DNA-binding transcriptional LysR family regulator